MKVIAYILVILGSGMLLLGGLHVTEALDTETWSESLEFPHHERFTEEDAHCHVILEDKE